MAVLVDLAYYSISKNLGEQYLIPLTENGGEMYPLPALSIAVTVIVMGVIASLLFAFLVRFTRKPTTIFLSVAITALIVSLGGPFRLPETELRTRVFFGGMHILAAILITGGILLLSLKRNPSFK
jgi:hypothetical protein